MTDIYIIVDPVQDWEESMVIHAAYTSHTTAVRELPRIRSLINEWNRNGTHNAARQYLQIQHWEGSKLAGVQNFYDDGEVSDELDM